MRTLMIAILSILLFGCATTEEQQRGELVAQFEDGTTALRGVVDCSVITDPERERRCLEQVHDNRYLFDNE